MTDITRRGFIRRVAAVAAALGVGGVVPKGGGMRPAQATTRPTLTKVPPPPPTGPSSDDIRVNIRIDATEVQEALRTVLQELSVRDQIRRLATVG